MIGSLSSTLTRNECIPPMRWCTNHGGADSDESRGAKNAHDSGRAVKEAES